MKTEIKITNDASVCIIDIEGVIGVPEDEQFSDSSHSVATYERLRGELDKIDGIQAKEVVVNIRSSGGDVNDALLIYESLVALDAKITTRCFGYTASAATIIAQAASTGCREIASSALYLVHMSSSTIEGNASDLVERIDLLQKTDDRIASLYALRSNRDKEHFVELMAQNGGRGKWLTPKEVIEAGLADSIIGIEVGTKQPGILDKVKGWFSTSNDKEREIDAPVADINILHLPENSLPTTSSIAFEEGQNGVKGTKAALCEDPSLDGAAASANALAYTEDLRHLKFRRV